jgi:hypothetical protein
MFTFLKRGARGRPAPERRSARLGVESLETRQLPSASVLGTALIPPAVNYQSQLVANEVRAINILFERYFETYSRWIYLYTHNVPSLTGVNFAMTSQTNGGHYSLQIKTQTDAFGDTATFTGVLSGGDFPRGIKLDTGKLQGNPDGSISIVFTWGSIANGGNGVYHEFDGTITGQPGAYRIDGHVFGHVPDDHLSGRQV